ncbi:hypothetical protein EST38_g7976 [Candolleomyces aberdarensis]|uniref:Nephrocystin 3-like N-terminal domain-containing protein n=1 Tax=Candolleomyces aberdarensis TaxID=2316362 RepID=A0A4Q2DFT1_9AGAR|nr:hypothetical protein EST38_g7976 [Candolleomyces aberdarensis]
MIERSIQRRRSSITQANAVGNREMGNYNPGARQQQIQGNRSIGGSTVTVNNQQHSNAPIINGVVNGNVSHNVSIYRPHLDGLQVLYQHAATGAMHDSDERFPPPLCHPGTREVVVRRIIGWYLDESRRKKPIMWVYAPAGYGKTAVAGTVSEKLEALTVELGFCPVGATFFFWRTSQERNSPARFIITLAYQLVRSIPELQYPIDEVINADPMVLKKALEVQLRKLIVEPLRSLSNLDDIPNRLIIVDGIDECINSDRESRLEKKSAEDRETSFGC